MYDDYDHWGIDTSQAVPSELQMEAYQDWAKNKDKKHMSKIFKTFSKLINSEIGRYQGTLSPKLLASFAKKYTADAVRSFDPSKGLQLSTHLVNNLQRLHRLNYKNVQGLHLSEEIQRNMNRYLNAKRELIESGQYEPTDAQISQQMEAPEKLVKKIREQIKVETQPTYDPSHIEVPLEDETLDFVYHDLPDTHKKVLEHSVGYQGAPKLTNKEIAEELKVSPVRITQISQSIAEKLKGALGHA